MEKVKKLSKIFYQRNTIEVSKELLGKMLITNINNELTGGIIIETEAYLGITDKAAHSYKGRKTTRTEVLYNKGGIAYVYFVYGMYYGFNIVTRDKKNPEAVLIRAIKPMIGVEVMMKRRKRNELKNLTDGPGKLCIALGIDKKLNGEDLTKNKIWVEKTDIKVLEIQETKRIGIDYAEEYVEKLWRFTTKI